MRIGGSSNQLRDHRSVRRGRVSSGEKEEEKNLNKKIKLNKKLNSTSRRGCCQTLNNERMLEN
jgi:hypothetical protein